MVQWKDSTLRLLCRRAGIIWGGDGLARVCPISAILAERQKRFLSGAERLPSPEPRSQDIKDIAETLRIVDLVKSFRSRGHFTATLDPLGRTLGPLVESNDMLVHSEPANARDLFLLLKDFPNLNLEAVGLEDVDPNRRYFLGDHLNVKGARQLFWTVNELVSLLRASYCGNLTVESEHLPSKEQKNWIRLAMERPPSLALFTPAKKRYILYWLLYADHFERFLAKKFVSAKRFGIEGCESLIPGLFLLTERAAELGVENIELGMAHRGRLNVLHTLLSKPLGAMISEFKHPKRAGYLHVGDVKYHLGTRGSLSFAERTIHLSLSPNPSHLEAVNPVVVGKTRAKQFFTGDTSRSRVMGLLLHGDAAFSGLGLAAEVMQLSDLPEYTTGGTVHVIINNQIGFTTDPKLARSSPYPSDIAKSMGAPIFHVNADDPEAVAHACRLAVDWRQTFKKDVLVDLVCYRRHGHNEQDDPRVTQPLTYQRIAEHPTALEIYSQRLLAEGSVQPQVLEEWSERVQEAFEAECVAADKYVPTPQEWLAANWQGEALGLRTKHRPIQPTGLPMQTLLEVGRALCRVPEDFNVHPDVAKLLEKRRSMVETGAGVDWAMAEALAFGSLMLHANPALGQTLESNPHFPVRLSGQDCERGTFNQRHAVLYDQTTAMRYTPLNHIAPGRQARFLVCNSNLSEAAVLGFEYGFSLENENALVIWEAQFGDFSNNAQLIIDNFIASGEDKWMTATGLVLLLPHGFDGQGPDHSSARPERFLQLCNDDPDHLPGMDPQHSADIDAGFRIADPDGKGYISRERLFELMTSVMGINHDRAENLLQDHGIARSDRIHWEDWKVFMAQWARRNAEKDHNMCIVNVTTPANYFHVLRRQMNRRFSKPLIVMSPKSLLHHAPCRSSLEDMNVGTSFRRVIADGDAADNLKHSLSDLLPRHQVRRILICSGKMYYALAQARRTRKAHNVALVRLEQIAPFPFDRLATVIQRYPPNADVVWVQEEPKNMGAWSYVQPRIQTTMRHLCSRRRSEERGAATSGTPITQHDTGLKTATTIAIEDDKPRFVRYVGRAASASTATGSFQIHLEETKTILVEAFAL